ncbi:hypothetical protein CROQUDRAFT_655784 [Cronartium quercuum f. sp. fusiforme G11]|uniref:Uncharacterized protein n=1 Tax=Cronartium quercuum f. sp. fusiforme G11 TaxID=708437 RepID=A0A9P6TCV2_9BASI|nr:hypothetical protein CROQUDRAFT_655784 [Cronartium quercuum f. sp. fusiforme G11]
MLFTPLLSLAGFLLAVQAAKGPKPDRVSKLISLTKAGKGVVPLNDKLFEELVAGPRNYSITVVLTALGSQFQCVPCQTFEVEYNLIAKQWAKQPQSIRESHFFAVLDFKEGKGTFQKLGLNTAPQARNFLPTTGPRAVDAKHEVASYDFNRGGTAGLTAEQFSRWASSTAHIPHFFKRPPNYGKIFATVCVLLASVIAVKVAWPAIKLVLGSRYIWAVLTIPFILLMTGGQMWNQIRHPPYMTRHQNGAAMYIAGGYGTQYQVETHLIAGLYGMTAFAAYTLAFTVSRLDDPVRQRIAVYIWLGVLLTMASFLMNIFRMKNGGYPFKFLF